MAKAKKKVAKKAAAQNARPAPEDIAQAIMETAAAVDVKTANFAGAKRYADATMKNERFNYHKRTIDGVPIRYFHKEGESETGTLGKPQQGIMFWQWLYPLVKDDGTLIYLPNNRRLAAAIKKAKCLFMRVTITYKGRLRTARGHYQKVYTVEAARKSSGRK